LYWNKLSLDTILE